MRAFGFDVGAGVTVNSAAVAAAQASVPAGAALVLEFPSGEAEVQFTLRSNTSYVGAGSTSTTLKAPAGSRTYVATCDSGSPLVANNIRDVHFRNIGFEGRTVEDGFDEHTHLVNLNGVTQVSFRSCKFAAFRGDAIYLGSSNTPGVERHNESVAIAGCTFDGVTNETRNGISIIDGRNIWIDSCTFTNVSRADMPGCIDIEPNPGNTWAVIRDIRITNNSFVDTLGIADVAFSILPTQAQLTTQVSGLVVSGNTHNSPSAQLFFFLTLADADANTPTYALVYSNNTQLADISGADITLDGLRGAVFSGNTFRASHSYSIGATYACYDIVGAP